MQQIFDNLRRYNCWDGNLFPIGFQRNEYLNNIVNYLDNRLIKVLVGQRRTGKSYLLRQIIKLLIEEKRVNPKNVFYFNNEFIGFDKIRSATDLDTLFMFYKSEIKPEGKIYIFLDEIQNVESWEKFVNSYSQDFTNDYELFITGSNSKLLSGELATQLSGRFVEFHVFPFSFHEYCNYKKSDINRDNFIKYLKTGGLPEMLHLEGEEIKRHYVESLKNTIILRDIVERYKIKDVQLLEDIFGFLIANAGNLTSLTSLVKYFKSKLRKTNYETLSTYVSYLKDTFLIHEASRYQLRGKEKLSGQRKYYLNDLAFKNYLSGYYPFDIGYNLENFIYLQLRISGYKVSVGIINGKEIDFVAEKGEETKYFQVSYVMNDKSTIDREYSNLLLVKDNFRKYVVSLDEIKFSGYKGIEHLWPWEVK